MGFLSFLRSAPQLFFPRFDRLIPQKSDHRLQLLPFIPGLQRRIIGLPVLLVNDNRRVIVQKQKVVHHQPSDAPVSVREGVDVLKLRMEIRGGSQFLSLWDIRHLCEQFRHLLLHILGRRSYLQTACHIIMVFVLAGTLAKLPSPRIVRIPGQILLKLLHKRFVKRTSGSEGRQQQFIGIPGVSDFKQCPQIPGIGDYTSHDRDEKKT